MSDMLFEDNTTIGKEVQDKLKEAFGVGKFFIMITNVDKKTPDKLRHFFIVEDFPTEDIPATLNHYRENIPAVLKKNKKWE
jgi:hypothetical protein